MSKELVNTTMAHLKGQLESSAKLLARAASCEVTPRDRPVRLAGYLSREATSTVLDPIEISVVLLECSGQRCLIFSFDLMIIGTELQNLIIEKLHRIGFQPDEVMLLASHTHSAPATDQACARLGIPEVEFVGEVAEATENLVRGLGRQQPAEINLEVFRGRLEHSINRRRYWPFPTFGRTYGFRLTSMSFAPNPSGPKDECATVALLRKVDDGQVLGMLWHYTCHPTAVVPDNVISADYPGVVRRALRERFGEIPCVFAQGFCGDVRPNMPASQRAGMRERLRRVIRTIASGPTFPPPSVKDWMYWSQSLAAAVCDIVEGSPARRLSPSALRTGSAQIPLGEFFAGAAPDKLLAVQLVQIGEELEIVALSAEPCVDWERILDQAVPRPAGRIRLYAGYLGALFGYLPTAAQIPEGGYEVEGFQPLFGLGGRFNPETIAPSVIKGMRRAFGDLNRSR
ncbi:hypothetical protein [Bradyrhizobium japonicum]|uniref:hypothetical protein n=1 Tax=Bradyrhizobium japonicum TaxID=375 RepID=UPI0012BBDE29|nr:hypothetical protein [Bradyrhizobium japonicum]